MTDDKRAREAVEAALEGMSVAPWEVGPYAGHVCLPDKTLIAGCRGHERNFDMETLDREQVANAEGIATRRNHAPTLLSRISRLEALLREAKTRLLEVADGDNSSCDHEVGICWCSFNDHLAAIARELDA